MGQRYIWLCKIIFSVAYLQRVSNFVGDEDPAFRSGGVVGGDAAGAELGDGEIPLRFIPGAQETVHVEVRHCLVNNQNKVSTSCICFETYYKNHGY